MCNVTVFQVDLSEVEGVRAGPDRTGPGSILVARGLLPVGSGACTCVARGLLPGGPGASTVWLGPFTRVVRGLLLHEEDLGSPQLFQASVTVCR